MKKAVILHGTGGTPDENWFPWLKQELESKGYDVWVPQLPGADTPNSRIQTDFLLSSGWDFDDNLIIGHSAGAVLILYLLQNLPPGTQVEAAVFAAAFSQVLAEEPDWKQLKELFSDPLNYETIKSKARKRIFVHAADDPWCDPEQARQLSVSIEGEYVLLPTGQHFSKSLDPSFAKSFPALKEILEDRQVI